MKKLIPKAVRDYQENLLKIRRITNANQALSDKRTLKILEKAHKDLTLLMNMTGPEKVSYSVYASKRTAIDKAIAVMVRDYGFSTRASIYDNAIDVRDIYSGLNEKLVKDSGVKVNWSLAFTNVPRQATNNVISRVWNDGLTFSDRLWRLNTSAVKGVNEILSSGIARGQSAVNMSKDLQQYLLEPAVTDGTSWTTGISKSVTGRGTINYNALRLASTEINNSYREALVVANGANPIMLGLRWNLSTSHNVPDICDVYAKLDAYGKGPGIYPADKMPIDHPGGRCFFTEVLRAANQWAQDKPEMNILDLSESEILAPMGQSATEGQRTAALKMWNATNQLINTNLRKAA